MESITKVALSADAILSDAIGRLVSHQTISTYPTRIFHLSFSLSLTLLPPIVHFLPVYLSTVTDYLTTTGYHR